MKLKELLELFEIDFLEEGAFCWKVMVVFIINAESLDLSLNMFKVVALEWPET